MNKLKLLVIGSLNMDLVVNVSRMPKVGETIFGQSFKTVPGGKGANQAFAASKLGGKVYMLGKIGTDAYGQTLIDGLNSVGVNTDSIEKQQDMHTGIAFIHVNSDGDNNIIVIPGANNTCSKEYIDKHKELIELCDIIMLQLEIPLDVVLYTLAIARQMNKIVILNPAPAPDIFPDDILKNVNIITPNETELQKLTGIETKSIDDIKRAANILLDKGVETVIVTCGNKGAVLATKDRCSVYQGMDVKAVDTTAAGDAFIAAVAVSLSEGKALDEAIKYANKVAAVVVTREGAQTSIPTKDEVEKFFRSNI